MNKPFSSFNVKGSLREKWRAALKDPAYIFLWLLVLTGLIIYAS